MISATRRSRHNGQSRKQHRCIGIGGKAQFIIHVGKRPSGVFNNFSLGTAL